MKNPFRSLYLKIFIWFWIAMIIINVVLFAAFALTRPTPPRRSWRDLAQTRPNAQKAAEIYEQSGPQALTAALQATEKSSGVGATFFDEDGKELSGRVAPQGAQELIAKAAESRDIEFNFAVENTLVARPVTSAKGQRYIYLAHIPPPPFQPTFQSLGVRLLVVLVIGGIFCYWLARYLMQPILKLRTTTNELAEGNLGARVSTKLARRRDGGGQLCGDFNSIA